MTSKEDAVEVIHFSLVPVGAIEQAGDAGNRGRLVGIGLDPNTGVVSDREQIVDDLESVLARGVVGCGDGANLSELGGSVVFGKLVQL